MTAVLDAAHWQRRLDELATEYRIPGAVLAISHGTMPNPALESALIPIDATHFAARDPESGAWFPVTFHHLGNGRRYATMHATVVAKTEENPA
ncbi:hypothetical protein D5S18_14580 [Nocardia panacis]|uniref:Uncharacterized protein n=1 Tax=Nocardia panacis TaxID=2340916 RepID=A0A3A4KRF8_9NOCA|nr:hypothetical protein [Nocardia panacis]RJO75640.1 hypothetical protein D5S18_14580 [Nocardia panacis]